MNRIVSFYHCVRILFFSFLFLFLFFGLYSEMLKEQEKNVKKKIAERQAHRFWRWEFVCVSCVSWVLSTHAFKTRRIDTLMLLFIWGAFLCILYKSARGACVYVSRLVLLDFKKLWDVDRRKYLFRVLSSYSNTLKNKGKSDISAYAFHFFAHTDCLSVYSCVLTNGFAFELCETGFFYMLLNNIYR